MNTFPIPPCPNRFDYCSRRQSGRFRYVNVVPTENNTSIDVSSSIPQGGALFSDSRIVRETHDKYQQPYDEKKQRQVQFEDEKKAQDEVDHTMINLNDYEDYEDDFSFASYNLSHNQATEKSESSIKETKVGWSWSNMLEKAEWEILYDSIEEHKDDFSFLYDEMILDSDTTALHIAAWKAPPALTLLLLKVMSNATKMNDDFDIKNYLLCGDSDGNTPLAVACANLEATSVPTIDSATLDFTVIKNLLLLAPEALEMVNNNGDTPLHLLLASKAFQRGTSFEVESAAEEAVTALLSMVGHLGVAQTSAGCTPLHVAIANNCHERVIVQLLTLAPEAVEVPDIYGMLPLHYAAAYCGSPWTIAGQLVWLRPSSICCQTVNGDTPLHLLVTNVKRNVEEQSKRQDTTAVDEQQQEKSYSVDRRITKLSEILVRTGEEENSPLLIQNNEGLTPFHCCILFDAPSQLTRHLLEHSSADLTAAALVLKSESGSTALHLAVAAMSSQATADKGKHIGWKKNAAENFIAVMTPEACAVFDADGQTPLMFALHCKKASATVVRALLKELPESSCTKNAKNLLPLHLAARNRRIKASIVKALIKENPAGVSAPTKSGNTPLHEACKYGTAPAVIKLLIENYPSAVYLRNSNGELPIDLANANAAKTEVLSLLERATL